MADQPLDRSAVISQLRANRARLLQDKTTTIGLPGWDSLSARYRRLPWEQVKGLAGLGTDDATVELGAAMEVLISACEEVLFDGEGLGLRYEQGLADLIGDEDAKAPAEVVNAVFPDELSLMTHAGDYMAWATRAEQEASETLGNA
jgi:hypothetical protein